MSRRIGENSIISKQHNRGLILQLVVTGECTSRIELARKTKLTKMTVSNIVSEFIAKHVLEESEEERTETCGRNPIRLCLSPNAPKVIGLLVFRGRLEAVVCDLSLTVIRRECISFTELTEDLLTNDIYVLIDKMLAAEKNVLGIGVAAIGPVDLNRGMMLHPPRFHGVGDIKLVELLEKRYGYPVYFDHDNNSAALAERLFGNGRDVQDFIFLGISNGIGSGIVNRGEVLHNSCGYAPEIGHVSIHRNGIPCDCGNRGCLEMYASTYIVLEKLKQAVGKDLTFREYCQMTEEEGVRQIFSEMMEDISVALISSVNILQTELILMGHDSVHLQDSYLRQLEEQINRCRFVQGQRRILVRKAYFGERAQLLGGAANVLIQVFKGELVI